MTIKLRVLGLPYGGHLGGKDWFGTYFSPNTEFYFSGNQGVFPVFRTHGDSPGLPIAIGRTVGFERLENGVWFNVELEDNAESRMLYSEAQQGNLFASSGALPGHSHWTNEGEMLTWAMGELSLVLQHELPANHYAVALPDMRQRWRSIGRSLPVMWTYSTRLGQWVWSGAPPFGNVYPPAPGGNVVPPIVSWEQDGNGWLGLTQAPVPPVVVTPPTPRPAPLSPSSGPVMPVTPAPAPVAAPAPAPVAAPANVVAGQRLNAIRQADPAVRLQALQQELATLQVQLTPPPPSPVSSPLPTPGLIFTPDPILTRGTPIHSAMRSLVSGRHQKIHIELWDGSAPSADGETVLNDEEIKASRRALSETIASSGGLLVPIEHSTSLIELLVANTALLRTALTLWPMASASTSFPKKKTSATAYWTGEAKEITKSNPTFGSASLIAKKLAALTSVPSELFDDSNPQIEAIVNADLAEVMGLEIDQAGLAGTGTNNQPTGLDNIDGINIDVTSLGANGSAPDFDDLSGMVYNLDAENVKQEGRAWIINPRTVKTLRELKINSEANHYAWADPLQLGYPPSLWGYPVFMSTSIPIDQTQGTSSDCSTIYLGYWPDFVLGQLKILELALSKEAGDAFEYDLVYIRAILRADVNVRHAESFELLRGVRE